jgi:hypothetical protein
VHAGYVGATWCRVRPTSREACMLVGVWSAEMLFFA